MIKSSKIFYGVCSSKGIREENQDSVMVLIQENMATFAVADGLGGYQYGKEASNMVLDSIKDELKDCFKVSLDEVYSLLSKKYQQATGHIYSISKKKNITMGTTVSVMNFCEDQILISNIGDSAIYRVRNNEIRLLSTLHTTAYEKYLKKEISFEQYLKHEKKNILTQAVGCMEEVKPFFLKEKYYHNDVYVICSDGLYNYVGETELSKMLNENLDCNTDIENICQKIVRQSLKNGSKDNSTIIVIKVSSDNNQLQEDEDLEKTLELY